MKEIQKRVREFCKKNNISNSPEHRLLDTVSELGEVAKEILKASDYGTKEFKHRDEIKSEVGDLLFSLIVLANSLNIDLDDALNIVLKKYEKRLKKGSADSENDKEIPQKPL